MNLSVQISSSIASLLPHVVIGLLQCKVSNTSYNDELHRTIIHGILHLCGINDKGEGEREIMEAEENKALALLK